MDETTPGTPRHRAARQEKAETLARSQGGILSRRQLHTLGVTRSAIEAQLVARRWRAFGRHGIGVTLGDHEHALFWRALFEIGGQAVLDGPSALIAAGLRNITCDQVHVAIPKSSWRQQSPLVVVHETRRFREEDIIRKGIPRTKPAVAAVHSALWVPSEKQAALFVLASVQQKIVRPDDFEAAARLVRRDPRLDLLLKLVEEVNSGIRSIGERDFARMCHRRGFPPPTRQVLRQGPNGRVYLDVYWEDFKVCVEIDGIHHLDPRSVIDDSLKQNAMMLEGVITLRIPVTALRQDPEPFLDQVQAALKQGGWDGRPASAAPRRGGGAG